LAAGCLYFFHLGPSVHQTLIWGLSNAENGFTFAKVGLE
jgi:hypothetical protein